MKILKAAVEEIYTGGLAKVTLNLRGGVKASISQNSKLSPTTKSIKGSFYERSLDNAYEISVDESNLVSGDTKAADAIKNWFSKVQEKDDAAA